MNRKSFKDNPALQFISGAADPSAESAPAAPQEPPEGYKVNPLFVETRSRRLQLVIQPSLYSKIKDRAAAAGISVNEFIHQTLERATREE